MKTCCKCLRPWTMFLTRSGEDPKGTYYCKKHGAHRVAVMESVVADAERRKSK